MVPQVATLAVLVALAMWGSLTDAASLMKKLQPRASSLLQRHPRSIPDFDGWGCPDLKCPPVSEDCQLMEVIAFRYERGECLGCPYCIDLPDDFYDTPYPSSSSSRDKRSIPADQAPAAAAADELLDLVLQRDPRTRRAVRRAHLTSAIIQNELCERVTCPVSPPESSCHHPGMLDGYLRNSKCISCPACLDNRRLQ